MSTDDLKAAEARGYSRGYKRGRATATDRKAQQRRAAEREAFRRRVFLAALPACIAAQNWKRGEKPITSLGDRIALAWEFADEAVRGIR